MRGAEWQICQDLADLPLGPTATETTQEKPMNKLLLAALAMTISCGTMTRAAMLDPATDDPARNWCYLAKSTTWIGVPFQPDMTQVTFDGALFTGSAELCFFYGQPLRPLLARQKVFTEGWIPIVQYDWREGSIHYDIEMFAAPLDENDVSNTINFVRLRMRNTGDRPAQGVFAAAMRHCGGDCRLRPLPFNAKAAYTITDDAALRDQSLVYTFPAGAVRQAVPGKPYSGPFNGQQYAVKPQTEVCLARYDRKLAPGQSAELVFKMPRVPVRQSDTVVDQIRAADYAHYRQWTVDYWKTLFARGTMFEIPEARVEEAQRACLVHLMLATKQRNGRRFQTSGLPYPEFFANDFIDQRLAYDTLGHADFNEPSLARMIELYLNSDDIKRAMQHGWDRWPTQGQVMYSLGHHYLMTRDEAYARRVWPKMRLAVEVLRKGLASDPDGLVPEVGPYDAEMIKGRYTSHSLWCLLGLRAAIVVARELGQTADAQSWLEMHDQFLAHFLKAVAATARADGYVPPGLYKYITDRRAGGGWPENNYNHDWENMQLAYRTEVLPAMDRHVAGTLKKVHGEYNEGILSYRHNEHIHHYDTIVMIQQYMVRGEARQALLDFYHVLLHCGSTYECFECGVCPWQDRMVVANCPPPHAWAAGKIALCVRDFLVHEYGGRAGLDPSQRDLYLFPVISPQWAKPGQKVALRNAATEMGPVSATMAFDADGAQITVQNKFLHPPAHIVVRVPYFASLRSFTTDAKESHVENGAIVLSPDVTQLSIVWAVDANADRGTFEELLLAYRREPTFSGGPVPKPAGPGFLLDGEKRNEARPLSFALVLEAFRHEYARRYAEFIKAGGKPTRVLPIGSKQ
jgi:hypothetical protein